MQRITASELGARLPEAKPPVLLDARRSEAFRRHPQGIPGAIPVLLDESELQLPDLPRDTVLVVYCVCSGQASSTRVALRLRSCGYSNVCVLEGGLPEWERQGRLLGDVRIDARDQLGWIKAPPPARSTGGSLIAESAFLAGESLPLRRNMAVLFVDMVDSTQMLFRHTPERMLEIVQAFMQIVVDVAVQHCGDVHDFEGDGAMLYFAGPGEAVPAVFDLRTALATRRREDPELPEARFAIDAGPLVVGYIGSRERRSLSFIGPGVNTAARILKLAPPGGIAATESVVAHAGRSDPDLAAQFRALPEKHSLKGFDKPVEVFVATKDDLA